MGLFSNECKHCGSKEHASEDCPHGIFSTKCKHCGSKEHDSKYCPHDILSNKCKHCGSVNHASKDCPQGIFATKCKHCGSKEHASENCPHSIFSTKCKHCGSINHASENCPNSFSFNTNSTSRKYKTPSDSDGASLIVYGVLFMIALAIVLYIAMIALFLSPLGLLIWYLIKKRKTEWFAIVGMLIAVYLIYDISYGGLITDNLMHIRKDGSEKYLTLGYFGVLAITFGFFIDKYSATKIPIIENGNFFTQKDVKSRRPIIVGFSTLLFVIFAIFNFVDFSNSNAYNYQENNSTQNSNSNTYTSSSKNENTNSTIDYSNKIKALLIAEQNRDFDKIKTFYAKKIYRYWNVYNIGYDELKKQHEKSWKVTLNSKNNIQSIKKINNNIYILNTIFTFYHIKQQKNKSIHSSVKFEFNNNGKIIRTYQNN